VVPLPSSSPAAQRDTRGAIAAGAGIGHAAMVRGCLDRLRLETACPRTVLTGGGMDDLAIDGAERRPWLVLEGLELLVSGSSQPPAPSLQPPA
jgi:pantothenate kinase type III